jgi:cytochrome c biogenesis protein ResB
MDSALNPAVFANIKDMLMQQLNKTKSEADCMVNEFAEKKIVDKFYSANIINDKSFLRKSLEPFLPAADAVCKFTGLNKESDFGAEWIAVIIGAVVIIGVVVGLIIRARKNSR